MKTETVSDRQHTIGLCVQSNNQRHTYKKTNYTDGQYYVSLE